MDGAIHVARPIDDGATGVFLLTDWRRRITELYRRARDTPASESSWASWRTGRDDLFRTHGASPIPPDRRAGYVATPFFPYDPAARITAVVDDASQEAVEIGGSHGSFGATRFAVAGFEVDGTRCSLDLFWLDGYGGGLFVPFRDATASSTSYGAGRYLLDTVKGADLGMDGGDLVLDFNFAYNPSCAYDPRWACPLAPPGNRLDIPIEAGERQPA
jgi:uncharacterized protein